MCPLGRVKGPGDLVGWGSIEKYKLLNVRILIKCDSQGGEESKQGY